TLHVRQDCGSQPGPDIPQISANPHRDAAATVRTPDSEAGSAVTISLVLQDGLITLDITDNGRGLGTPARSSGLSSMRRRAERNGGAFHPTTPAHGRTHPSRSA